MGTFIPAGRLSAVKYGDQRIEIQTEFSKYPEPRIATSVSLAGQVIHKIQKLWGKPIDSIDEMRVVEEIINKQHNEVTALIHEHAHTLVEQVQAQRNRPGGEQILDQVGKVEHVQSAFILTSEGKLVARQKITKEAEIVAAMIASLTEILFDIGSTMNLGDCEDCVLNLGSHDLLLLPFQGGYLAVLVDSKVRKREVLEQLWKIARAA